MGDVVGLDAALGQGGGGSRADSADGGPGQGAGILTGGFQAGEQGVDGVDAGEYQPVVADFAERRFDRQQSVPPQSRIQFGIVVQRRNFNSGQFQRRRALVGQEFPEAGGLGAGTG